ncbi:MAG: GTPase Era [Geminicoccaceae bacterium]|nr:GTPase Era [Geminicoccaceae bacterium]
MTATRAGFVAILGAPNVGKSTLLNRLVGSKVSIVSPKAQTTRRRIIGISMVEGAQVLFIDTPGIFDPKRRLDRAMVAAAWNAAADADEVLFVIDAKRGLDANARRVLEGLTKPAVLAVNKVDLARKDRLLPLIADLNAAGRFDATFLVSALEGDGCPDLLNALARRLPEGPWLYPEDAITDLSNRALAAEIVRERVFHLLHQELPYSITVETEAWAEAPDGKEIRIDLTVYVQRDSQKAIVLGKGGGMIRRIGEAARKELEAILEARIHLFLFVKVRENWQDDPNRYGEMGLDFPRR